MMTTIQKRKLLKRIQEVETDLQEMKRARSEAASSGYASAMITSQGGSKSYTRFSLDQITNAISALTSELRQLRSLLKDAGNPIWKTVLTVYS